MFGVLVVALRFLVGGCERCLNLGFVNSVDYAIPFVLRCLRLGQFVCLFCGSVQITGFCLMWVLVYYLCSGLL